MSEKRNDPRRPIPSSGYNKLRQNLQSGFAEGFPVENFPNPDNRTNINKGTITSRKDDTVQDVSIGLLDHDEAVMYYFNNVIKPSIISNGDNINVPVMYGAPERWKSIQKDGYFRDKEGKLQVPLIMFKRNSVEKRRDLGNKLDANNPQLYYIFQEKHNKRNQYDNFSVLQGRTANKEFHAVVIPDYVKLKYSFIIWTDYVAHMNKIVEAINYASDSYWGDEERFKFNARIDTFTNKVEIAQGKNRMVKTDFGLELQGYIVPDAMNAALAKKPQKFFSTSAVTFNTEVITTTGPTKTREEVRKESGEYKTGRGGTGVGFDNQDDDNTIG